MKSQRISHQRVIRTAFIALLAAGLETVFVSKPLARELTRATILAEARDAREVRSDKLGVSFSIPTYLRTALTTKQETAISILTPNEYEELSRSSRGNGSAHGPEDEATITVKPLPFAKQSALDNLYANYDYLEREGFDIAWTWIGGQQAVSMNQEVKCCYGDPYVSNIIAAISPDRAFLLIVRGGRDKALFRQIVSSFRFL